MLFDFGMTIAALPLPPSRITGLDTRPPPREGTAGCGWTCGAAAAATTTAWTGAGTAGCGGWTCGAAAAATTTAWTGAGTAGCGGWTCGAAAAATTTAWTGAGTA